MAATKEWLKQVDESNNVFFYNAKTGATQWEVPEGYVDTLGKDWVEALDEAGTLYYYNIATGEASWNHPAGDAAAGLEQNSPQGDEATPPLSEDVAAEDKSDAINSKEDMPEWSKVFDPSSKMYYYVNNHTLESRWDEPEGYQEVDLTKVKLLMAPEVRAAMLLQSAFRAKKARQDVRVQRAKTSGPGDESGWREILDPASGFPYYFNAETNEVTWDKPADFGKKDDDAEVSAKASDAGPDDAEKGKNEAKAEALGPDEVVEDLAEDMVEDVELKPPEWVQIFDPQTKLYYYFNNRTLQSQWEEPEGFERIDFSKAQHLMAPELRAALMMQCAFRAKKARQAVRVQRGLLGAGDASDSDGSVWSELIDPKTNLAYYYNRDTHETTWDAPEGFGSQASKPADGTQDASAAQKNSGESPKEAGEAAAVRADADAGPDAGADAGADADANASANAGAAADVNSGADADADATVKTDADAAKPDPQENLTTPESEKASIEKEEAADASTIEAEAETKSDTGEVEEEDEIIEWVEVFDPQTKMYYFFNNHSLESQWEEPVGFMRKDLSKAKHLMAPELRAAIMMQCAFRAKRARRDVRVQRGKISAAVADGGSPWQELDDPSSGLPYYYNSATEETTWDKPRELMTDEERASADAAAAQPRWYTAVDTDSGDVYFYNVETEEVSWEKPDDFDGDESLLASDAEENERLKQIRRRMALAVQGKLKKRSKEMEQRISLARAAQARATVVATHRWYEVYDEEHEAFYYYDVDTRITVWEKPEDFVMEASDELLHAALLMQGLFRSKKARCEVRKRRAIELTKHEPADQAPLWVKIFDKDADTDFWFHKIEQTIVWEEPPLIESLAESEDSSSGDGEPPAVTERADPADSSEATAPAEPAFLLEPTAPLAEAGDGVREMDASEPEADPRSSDAAGEPEVIAGESEVIGEPDEAERSAEQDVAQESAQDFPSGHESQANAPSSSLEEPAVGEDSNDAAPTTEAVAAETPEVETIQPTARDAQESEESRDDAPEARKTEEIVAPAGTKDETTVDKVESPREEAAPETQEERRAARARERSRVAEERRKEEIKAKELLAAKTEARKAELLALRTQSQNAKAKARSEHVAEKKTLMKAAQAAHEKEARTKEAAQKKRNDLVLGEKKEAQQRRIAARAAQEAQREKDIRAWTKMYNSNVRDVRARVAAQQAELVKLCAEERDAAHRELESARSVEARKRLSQAHGTIFEAVRAGVSEIETLTVLARGLEGMEDARNEFGRTPLHEACWLGFVDTTKAILAVAEQVAPGGARALVQTVDSCCSMTTPLHEAARAGWGRDLISVLLDAGASADARDHLGDIPLHCAARHGHFPAIKALIEADGGLEMMLVRNYKGRTALELAELRQKGQLPRSHDKGSPSRSRDKRPSRRVEAGSALLGPAGAPVDDQQAPHITCGESYTFDGDFVQTVDLLRSFHHAAIAQFGPELTKKRKLNKKRGSTASTARARKSKLHKDDLTIRNMFPRR